MEGRNIEDDRKLKMCMEVEFVVVEIFVFTLQTSNITYAMTWYSLKMKIKLSYYFKGD